MTLGVWGLLAWRSLAGGASLGCMLALTAVNWAILIWALGRVTLADSRTIVLFGVCFRLIALGAPPVLEDDHYRFLWDGYRFAATGNPYGEAPSKHFADPDIPAEFHSILDGINHPDVPTIYGPACQWVFRLCHFIAPGRLWPWKLALLSADLLILAMLWPGLGPRGRLLLVWCPLVIFEIGFNVHPDGLAIVLLVASWWVGRRGHFGAAGALAGAAMAAKVFALLLVPFILWRLGRRAWIAAAVASLAFYAPFWLQGSAADFGGLRAMAAEWEFNSSVHAVLAALLSPSVARLVCGLTFGIVWLTLFARWRAAGGSSPQRPLPPGEWVYGMFLLLSAVANPWYALWLWPFVATRISTTGLVGLIVVSLTYVTGLNWGDPSLGNYGHPWWLRPVEFGGVGLAAIHDWRKRKPVRELVQVRERVAGR